MYSIVLMAAMTATPESPSFGDIWAKHCFWECCLPARYGWVPCGPGYSAIYPASYTSCYGYGLGGGYSGYGSHYTGWGSYYGCYGGYSGWGSNYGYRDVCFGSGAWGSNYGYTGGASNYGFGYGSGSWYHACGGGYYNCYGGGAWTGPLAGAGYSGFGGYGNFGYYNTVPFYSAPVYAAPGFERPLDTPIRTAPTESRPILDIKPTPVQPQKTMAVPAKASVVVRVPENAKVFIDGNLMHSTSTERKFTSPAIAAGESFFYTIRVVIQKEGKEVEEVRQVTVKAGEISRLAFDNLFDRVRPEERTIVDANKNPVK